ncbi:MAG: FAD-dependent oxidoreductase [Actinomycetota bacterium]
MAISNSTTTTSEVATTDVVVIGAGVIGSAIAFELARRGRSVICLDAGPGVGAGSTSASSAIIRFHYSTMASVLAAWESAPAWRDLAAHLGVEDPDGMARFVPTGSLVLDFPGSNREDVLEIFDRVGVPYTCWTGAEVKAHYPAMDVASFWPPKPIDDPGFADDGTGALGGYYNPDAGFIDDPMRAAGNFMYAARHHGAELRLRSKVVEIHRSGGRVVGVRLESGARIDAPVVVNAAGPHSGVVNEMAGVLDEMRIRPRPLRNEVHVMAAPPGFDLDGGTLVADLDLGTYFRPHLGGTMIVGGSEPACDPMHWVDDPDDWNDRTTVECFETQTYRAARRLPDLPIPHRPNGIAALYDASDDWVPIYDRTGLDGYFMACGTSGNQFKNAPMAGVFLAELIEAAERGIDHDAEPVQVVGPRTGQAIDLGAFSRLRDPTATTGTVMG